MPHQPPPAPPSIQPPSAHDPYNFILNPQKAPKKSLLPKGNPLLQRVIMICGGLLILVIAVSVVVSLLGRSSGSSKADWSKLMQEQTEIVRVSGLGGDGAQSTDTKNLAATTELSVQSDQQALMEYAKKVGVDTSAKHLALGKDGNTDDLLSQAKAANRFDATFSEKLRTMLADYQQDLKKLYDESKSQQLKFILSQSFASAGLLIGSGT